MLYSHERVLMEQSPRQTVLGLCYFACEVEWGPVPAPRILPSLNLLLHAYLEEESISSKAEEKHL